MTRIGQGWDIHRLVEGGPLRLGGVDIAYEWSLLGHSDGDVVLHAVADALLGAIAAGDIGTHFPDSDPSLRGVDSAVLLGRVVAMVAERGYRVSNVDVTVLAERPRLAPYEHSIRARIAALLRVDAGQVGLKAKTMEGIGEIGRGEAIVAMAVAGVYRP